MLIEDCATVSCLETPHRLGKHTSENFLSCHSKSDEIAKGLRDEMHERTGPVQPARQEPLWMRDTKPHKGPPLLLCLHCPNSCQVARWGSMGKFMSSPRHSVSERPEELALTLFSQQNVDTRVSQSLNDRFRFPKHIKFPNTDITA
jgi:hypothetical protein